MMQRSESRRQFLRLSVAGLGWLALEASGVQRLAALAATPEHDPVTRARTILKTMILEHARTRDDPWLLIHGIRALGKGFWLGDGTALEHLCSRYLQEKSVNDKAYLFMPREAEGHPNAFLTEAVLEAGVTADYEFRRNGRRYTIGDVVAGAKALFEFDPASFNPDELGWSLAAFAHVTRPGTDRWVNAYGQPIRFAEVVEFGMTTLEDATRQLRVVSARDPTANEIEVDRIHEFACAGTHLINGLATCWRFGHTQHALPERMKVQLDLLVRRLAADPRLIDRFYQEAAAHNPPELTRMYRLDARLKFLGHAGEVLNTARRHRLFAPLPAQKASTTHARQELCAVVEAIGREDLAQFGTDPTLLKTLVGDACHAYHALTMPGAEPPR
jgi:hypothetical protein